MKYITYKEARQIAESNMEGSHVTYAGRCGSGIVFAFEPDGNTKKLLDNTFLVTNEGEFKEYSTVMDPEEFKQALKNRLDK